MTEKHSLLRCPDTRNCVSSIDDHPHRRIEPLPGGGKSMALIRAVVESMPGATIESVNDGVLHATFRSRWLGFVDDLHIVVGETRVDVRSKSRIGYYDFGVNRRRVTAIAKRLRANDSAVLDNDEDAG